MIYFIGNEHGAIKIGYTADLNVQSRLNGLQSANADQLILLGYEDGTKMDEGNLHTKFAHLRIRGEWFAIKNGLLDYVLSLPTVDRESIQGWIVAMLPEGDTACLQQLREQIGVDALNVLREANEQAQSIIMTARAKQSYTSVLKGAEKRSQDIIMAAYTKADQIITEAEQRHKQIVNFATACAASDIKELVVSSCDQTLSSYPCCKCNRARQTVREREDGFPWCNPCWVNHAIFDSGRFDVIMAQTNDAVPYSNVNQGK